MNFIWIYAHFPTRSHTSKFCLQTKNSNYILIADVICVGKIVPAVLIIWKGWLVSAENRWRDVQKPNFWFSWIISHWCRKQADFVHQSYNRKSSLFFATTCKGKKRKKFLRTDKRHLFSFLPTHMRSIRYSFINATVGRFYYNSTRASHSVAKHI